MQSLQNKLFQKFLLLSLVTVMLFTSIGYADDVPYVTYNYDYWENTVYSPARKSVV